MLAGLHRRTVPLNIVLWSLCSVAAVACASKPRVALDAWCKLAAGLPWSSG